MKKYFINGEEVDYGSTISLIKTLTLNAETIKELMEEGILKEKEIDKYEILDKAMTNMAKSLGWKPAKLANVAKRMWEINPTYALRLYYKAIAIELDKQYPDHIRNSKEFWAISLVTNSPYESAIPGKFELKTFAFFRSEKDAQLAIDIMKEMYNYAKYGEASKSKDSKCD